MKEKKISEKILIIVSGGVVQNVYCSNPNFKVDLLDFDNEEFVSYEESERALEDHKSNLVHIY